MTWLKSLEPRQLCGLLPARTSTLAIAGPRLLPGRRRTGWFALPLLLAACATPPLRHASPALEQAQVAREQTLARATRWSFAGRIALSADGRGGSGRIDWQQRGADFDIRLTAPVTGQGWQLIGTAGQATLMGLEGGPRDGADAETLLAEATGWRVPLRAMAAWVRGARATGPAELEYDEAGRPALLVQQGWTVEYRDWDLADPPRPMKLYAKQAQASVRLVIDRWGEP